MFYVQFHSKFCTLMFKVLNIAKFNFYVSVFPDLIDLKKSRNLYVIFSYRWGATRPFYLPPKYHFRFILLVDYNLFLEFFIFSRYDRNWSCFYLKFELGHLELLSLGDALHFVLLPPHVRLHLYLDNIHKVRDLKG